MSTPRSTNSVDPVQPGNTAFMFYENRHYSPYYARLEERRQALLIRAKRLVDVPVGTSGCVSEESIYEPVHDSDDYQQALKELGGLFKLSSQSAYSLAIDNMHVCMDIKSYEILVSDAMDADDLVSDAIEFSDEEIENCGYLGWLS